MDLNIPTYLAFIASWLGLTGGIRKLFKDAEETIDPKIKKSVILWLKNTKSTGIVAKWPEQFSALFDSTFGKRHFSMRCFVRSCIASILSTILMLCIWALVRPAEFSSAFDVEFYLMPAFLIFPIIFNLLPDYLSLLETRYFIRFLNKNSGIKRAIVILLADVVLTASIFLFFFFSIVARIFDEAPGDYLKLMLQLSAKAEGDFSVGVFFYSTFFTSVWLWLYILAGLIVKLINLVEKGFSSLKLLLDIEQKPISSIGMVASILVTILYIFIALYQIT